MQGIREENVGGNKEIHITKKVASADFVSFVVGARPGTGVASAVLYLIRTHTQYTQVQKPIDDRRMMSCRGRVAIWNIRASLALHHTSHRTHCTI